MDEHVLRGNAAIVKCHIPSFVIDFVYVSAWILDDNNDDQIEIHAEHNNIDMEGIGISSIFAFMSIILFFQFFQITRTI